MSQYIIAQAFALPAAKAVEQTENSKTGAVSVTMASQASCPKACPFIDAGCYASNGPVGWTTAKLNRSAVTDPIAIAKAESAAIATLSGSRPLRLHVVGDCTTDQTARILAGAVRKYQRRGNQPVWTYSHAWRDVARKSFGTISTLASCESTEQVKQARKRGYATAIVLDRFRDTKAYTIDGVKVVPCPQQTGRAKDCASCKLCWNDARVRETGVTVAFEPHGAQANSVRRQLTQISLNER
jgi:hypothetical protein